MWKRKTDPVQVERLEAKIERAMVTLEALGSQMAALELTSARARELETEWLDMYEKFRNLYARISKRIERAAPPEDLPNGHATNPAAMALLTRGIQK